MIVTEDVGFQRVIVFRYCSTRVGVGGLVSRRRDFSLLV